jgi:hypothetical protein
MRVTVERRLVHRCPYVEEIDVGRVRASWQGDGVELYALAEFFDSLAKVKETHEVVTDVIVGYLAQHGGAHVEVVTQWLTAGMRIEVRAGCST